MLRQAFAGQEDVAHARAALRAASGVLIGCGLRHRARYRLLFSDPELVDEPSLKEAAFGAFSRIVARCQAAGDLPAADVVELTGLIYAALHGAIDLHIGGRATDAKGLGSAAATADLLFELLAR